MAALQRPALACAAHLPQTDARDGCMVAGALAARRRGGGVPGEPVQPAHRAPATRSTNSTASARRSRQRITQLEAEVARLSSLARVDLEARTRLHLEPAQQKLYITVNHAVPDRQTLPTRFLPAGCAGRWNSRTSRSGERFLKSLPFLGHVPGIRAGAGTSGREGRCSDSADA